MALGRRLGWLTYLGPGLLLAATGVGAGDLATGAFAGSILGTRVLWAVFAGAFLKFTVNEGLARWQLLTGSTLLEGVARHLGKPVCYAFGLYLVGWSFFVGSALVSACGVTMHALRPLWGPEYDKVIYGVSHSAIALAVVWWGGYPAFEKVMRICVAMMFFSVLLAAGAIRPPVGELLQGSLIPTIAPKSESWRWTVALMGGVGGTVTILCYGYWIREEKREAPRWLAACRWDLASGYLMTALFGAGMVVLGSRIPAEGRGARLIVTLADQLQQALGPWGTTMRWVFLAGAWAAVFSSLLGVWQSVPYLFADVWRLVATPRGARAPLPDTRSGPYRLYLLAIATVPLLGLRFQFQQIQQTYAIVGACFLPLVALLLAWLNGWSGLLPPHRRNSTITTIVLLATCLFFLCYGWIEVRYQIGG
ncbi:MAG: iron transporter [Pirellulaceae bacterium]|nr:MAG: iron transporter [Pirellulaceae bacterium]